MVKRVMADNGACYRSKVFNVALGTIQLVYTKLYRPRTNGEAERFNRTLMQGWACIRPCTSE